VPVYNFAQLGARYRYLYAALLYESGMLDKLYTDFWMPVNLESDKLPSIMRKMAGRRSDRISNRKVVSFYRLGYQLYSALKKSNDIFYQSEVLAEFGSEFAKRQLKSIDRSSGYIGMCSESLEVIRELKKCGSQTTLIQYDACDDSSILLAENRRWPDWSPEGNQRSPQYYRRVYLEWAETDRIMVNSEWTRDLIVTQGADPSKIYTVPLVCINRNPEADRQINMSKPLKVLFVGSVVLRKGVQYLIEAARLLNHSRFEFFILGQNYQSPDAFKGVGENVHFIGQIPFQEVEKYYRDCDVLVFPTLSDGFGSVQVEAMSYGLPVIATSSCASVAENEKSGFIIPPADSGSLVLCLKQLEEDRRLLEKLSVNAPRRAQEFSFENVTRSFNSMLRTVKEKAPDESC
jgi:glycosyltransferase involved in cell wall biosynthesis